VQQGGGASQLTNKIYLGWDGAALRLQVDTTDEGEIALRSWVQGMATQRFGSSNTTSSTSISTSISFTPTFNGTLSISANFGTSGTPSGNISFSSTGASGIIQGESFTNSLGGIAVASANYVVSAGIAVTVTITGFSAATATNYIAMVATVTP
jgi:hypothetical protein